MFINPQILRKSRVFSQLYNDPWKRLPSSLIPISIGSTRMALWFWAKHGINRKFQNKCQEIIGFMDKKLCKIVLDQISSSSEQDWIQRDSWAQLAFPDYYPDRKSGPDSLPESTIDFLLWSPISNNSAFKVAQTIID